MRKVQKDKQRAQALRTIAQETLRRLNELDCAKYPTNTVVDYYESIRKLIEAICCLKGIKFDGEGAHKQSIDYVCKEKEFTENENIFLQNLRSYRNRINYEGLFINEEFIPDNKQVMDTIVDKLNTWIKKEMNKQQQSLSSININNF